MAKLENVEFYLDPFGKVMIVDKDGVHSYEQEDEAFTSLMFARIEEDYTEAYKALCELYKSSIPNIRYYRWLVVNRFIRCNLSVYDRKVDIDSRGAFKLEEVQCPLRGECKHDGVICNARFNDKLTERQREVMRHYCEGLTYEEIAELLHISPETVKTIKRNAFRKAGVHDINAFRNKFEV